MYSIAVIIAHWIKKVLAEKDLSVRVRCVYFVKEE